MKKIILLLSVAAFFFLACAEKPKSKGEETKEMIEQQNTAINAGAGGARPNIAV